VTLPASHPDVEKYNRTIEPVTIISTNAPENFDRKDPSEISMPKEDIDRSRLHDDRPGLSKPQVHTLSMTFATRYISLT
jgi:hypothetical protein